MKIIDLTHLISEDMPIYPDTVRPRLNRVATFEEEGYMMTHIFLSGHTGTHMDAPAHAAVTGRTTLDQMPIDQFVGKAFVVDCSDLREGQTVTMDYINKDKDKADKAEFILFWLGWDKYWGTDEKYYGNYPCLDDEVVQYLIDSNKKGAGFDIPNPDPIEAPMSRHNKLFAKNEIVVIENLNNLGLCGKELFTFIALPLRFKKSDGSPIRAIALWE